MPAIAMLVASVASLALPRTLRAQGLASPTLPAPIAVGTESEGYLRSLQALGLSPAYPWSIRGFSLQELDRLRPHADSAHPWSSRPELRAPARTRGPRWGIVPPRVDAWYNTTFPFGMNDGAVWRGRGLTLAAHAGAAARWGPVSLTLDPLLFWAENRDFPLMDNGLTGAAAYANAMAPAGVDAPQRFGTRAYARLEPGQSTLRVDLLGLAAGVSTANQWWGPMTVFPYILGNNAAGFAHAFVGTGRPLNLYIGTLHGRAMYGRLSQSSYAVDSGVASTRFASALAMVFTPRGAPGLELGGARFYHVPWPVAGLKRGNFTNVFGVLTFDKATQSGAGPFGDAQNQLASVFFRWVLPRSGLEVFGEFGHEDWNMTGGDLLQEPDYLSTYAMGVRKSWRRGGQRIVSLRGELMNFQISTLNQHRNSRGGGYTHSTVPQGHTERGQLLGAGFAVRSGAGATIALDRYTPDGQLRVEWMRVTPMDEFFRTPANDPMLDVQHALTVERRRVVRGLELGAALTAIYDINRHFRADVGSAQLAFSVRHLGR